MSCIVIQIFSRFALVLGLINDNSSRRQRERERERVNCEELVGVNEWLLPVYVVLIREWVAVVVMMMMDCVVWRRRRRNIIIIIVIYRGEGPCFKEILAVQLQVRACVSSLSLSGGEREDGGGQL